MNYSAGGYIEAWCTKCKLELGHTIIVMVENVPDRVKCNTCNGEHNFRVKPSEKLLTKLKSPVRKIRVLEANYNDLLTRLTGGDLSSARQYSMKENFKKDEVVSHPSFGIGIISSVIHDNKMEILFKDGPRLLIRNQS
ncbi:MAG: hypothetical protein HZB61_11900 [Nitrospirae bacterium]|nr:hypothetical protein [Nitrospirota bacterium]